MLLNIDGLVKETQASFDLFLLAVKGRYLAVGTSHRAVTPAVISELRVGAGSNADSTLSAILNSADSFIAIVSTLADEKTYARIQSRRVALENELKRIFSGCIESVVRDMKRTTTHLDVHGAMGLLAQRRASEPIFEVRDKAGRNWQADKLLLVVMRDFAYQSYLDARLHEISLKTDLAVVTYQNQDHPNNGLIFSISGHTSPALSDIRRKVFHPNSQAKVSAYVSPQ